MIQVKLRQYTKIQQAIIDGNVDIADVSCIAISCLLRKAKEIEDHQVVQLAEKLHKIKKEEVRQKTNERNKKAYHARKENGFAFKQPKSKEYTERQKKIINGEISLDVVLTRDLLDIFKRAKLRGDIELSEHMLSLYYDRKAESEERNRIYANHRSRNIWDNRQQHFSRKGELNKYELDVLDGNISFCECSIEHLIHIKTICEKNNDVEHLTTVNLLLEYKTNPERLYIVNNHEDALDIIEKLLTYPLRRLNICIE